MTATDPKPLLRSEMKRRRAGLATAHPFAGDHLAEAIAADLDATGWPAAGAIVAGYWPIQSEINPFPLLQTFEDRGYRLALPCLVPGADGFRMIFRRFRIGDDLIHGPFEIRQPVGSAEEVAPDLVLLPLLAFDLRGKRLGYGGGYYDRTLQALRARGQVTAWGLAFSGQQLAEIPFEAHDEPLDAILTETGLLGTTL